MNWPLENLIFFFFFFLRKESFLKSEKKTYGLNVIVIEKHEYYNVFLIFLTD